MSNSKTLMVITGGTIESFYNPEEGTPHYVPMPASAAESCIPAALKKMGLADTVDTYAFAMKDSKDITSGMLDHIVHKIANEGYDKVVIVHGTDTMPLHARYLKRRIAEYGADQGMDQKRIVVTGAMGPLRDKNMAWREPSEHQKFNDGWDNLARALQDVGSVQPGVYVEMGDGPKEADTIKKEVSVDVPGSRAAKVKHSGFVVEHDPKRHKEMLF